MNLDDWKDRAREVKAPGTGTGGPRPGGRSLDGLIRTLKAEDDSDRKRLRRTAIFFSILGVAYVLLFALTWILPPDPPPSPGMSRLALTLAFLFFLLIGWVSATRSRRLAGIDYAGPMRSFLDEAEHRYRFLNGRDLGAFVPIFLLTAALIWFASRNAFERYLPGVAPSLATLVPILVLAAACVAGVVLGRRRWAKKRAPILDEIRRIKAALAAEEHNGPSPRETKDPS